MLRVRLLGEPLVSSGGGRTISLWRPEIALVAVAALGLEGVRRAEAAALLWPEKAGDRARAALRQTLFRLRRRAPGVLEAHGDRLKLGAGVGVVDVLDLEERLAGGDLEGAAELYTGPLLEGFSLPGSTEFDQWVDGRRAGLHARVTEAVAHLVRREEGGRREAVLPWARKWSALSPLDGTAAQHLVRAHALSGDTTAALSAYEAFVRRLRLDLDMDPPQELEELAGRIRSGMDGGGAALGGDVPTGSGTDGAEGRDGAARREWPMVGRTRELRRLEARWREVQSGARRLVLLEGEAGMGKTRLAREFAARVRVEGATVLASRAYEVERGVPYSALAGLLVGALDAPGLSALDSSTLSELSRIAPAVARRFPGQVDRPLSDLEGGRFRLLHAVHSLLENLCYEVPVLLFLDDLPWADEATVAALHYAWRNLPRGPLLLLTTARSGELDPGGPGHVFWSSMGREAPDAVEAISLLPLSTAVIGRLAGPDRDARALRRRTGGNPLFLEELLREDAGDGDDLAPPVRKAGSIRTVVEERIARLGPDETRLLKAAAILGRRFPLPVATAVSELEAGAGVRAVTGLAARGLIRESGVEYDFVHDVVREIVAANVPTAERAHLHGVAYRRLLAAAREDQAPRGPSSAGPLSAGPLSAGPLPDRIRAGALARHAEGAGLVEDAFRWSLEAASRAQAVYAAEAAATYLRRARRAARGPEEHRTAWVRTGSLERARTRFGEAALAFLQALRWTERGSRERLSLRFRILECSFRGRLVEAREVVGDLDRLLAAAHGTGDPALVRDARCVTGLVRRAAGDPTGALEDARIAVAAGQDAGEPGALARALLLMGQAALDAREYETVLGALDQAVDVALEAKLTRELFDALADRGTELARLGRWDEALAGWREGLEGAVEVGDFGAEGVFRLNISDLLARRGQADEALRQLERLEAICRRFHFPHLAGSVPVNRSLAWWFAGDPGAAGREAARALEALEARPGPAGSTSPVRRRVARSVRLLSLLETGGGQDAVRGELEALEEGGPSEHAIWSDDRDVVALARARGRAALGDSAGALKVLGEALAQVQDPFGRDLLLAEEVRLRTAPRSPGSGR